jgi:aminoglycoside phosphotransferase family enzyme/predicted kinase
MEDPVAGSSTAQLQHGRDRWTNPELLAALSAPAIYPSQPPVAVHETHASWVFVAGERTYKIKKPLALGFLDYSTLARRRAACREEVRVNQSLAPDIYLGVRAIVASGERFHLAPDGAPGAVEYAVEMRTFDEAGTLAGLIAAGQLRQEHVLGAARMLADFHRSAPLATGWGPDRVLDIWRRNLQELDRIEHPANWRLEVPRAFAENFVETHAAGIRERAALGLARDGHGDLRCEHVLAVPALAVVDRIEFDPHLRRIDVACDLSFLAMDLEAHGQLWAARALIDAYRDAGLSPGGEQLRSFFAAHWALVRAKVGLIATAGGASEVASETGLRPAELWSLAERLCWRARAPLAVLICGPAASGKSTLAAELARRSELPVVSSDLVRKRLAGVGAGERARPEHYLASFTHATYQRVGQEAALALSRQGVIVDATCRSRRDRAPLLGRVRASGVRFLVVRCEVALERALARAGQRLRDPRRASDATPQVVEEQLRSFEELDELPAASVLRLDTAQPLEDQLAELALAVDACDEGCVPR